MARILVLYGTTEGHTAKIAQALAGTLRREGHTVDVVAATAAAPDPADYAGIVVTASVHGGRYQKSVQQWVRSHAARLTGRPTAFVSVSLGVLQREPRVQQEVAAIVNRFLAATGWTPTLTMSVAGALAYSKYHWIKRWVMRRIARAAGGDTDVSRDYEYTDWQQVEALALDFGRRVRERAAPPPAS
jgi:menaquinone-dependent protoporphyrinogen oxidase